MNLTFEQKTLLVNTWRKVDFDWLFEIGSAIYCEIFRVDPSVKEIFSYVIAAERENRDFKECKQYRAQALRFVQILGQALANLSENDPNDDELAEIIFQLGKRHRSLVSRGFKPEYWDIFETAVVHVMQREYNSGGGGQTPGKLLRQDQIATAVEGWKIVADYIIAGMKKGFNDDHHHATSGGQRSPRPNMS